jgi:hypothetical protein
MVMVRLNNSFLENLANHAHVSVIIYFLYSVGLIIILTIIVAAMSTQWYAWTGFSGTQQARLCSPCWNYWRKYGGFKIVNKSRK